MALVKTDENSPKPAQASSNKPFGEVWTYLIYRDNSGNKIFEVKIPQNNINMNVSLEKIFGHLLEVAKQGDVVTLIPSKTHHNVDGLNLLVIQLMVQLKNLIGEQPYRIKMQGCGPVIAELVDSRNNKPLKFSSPSQILSFNPDEPVTMFTALDHDGKSKEFIVSNYGLHRISELEYERVVQHALPGSYVNVKTDPGSLIIEYSLEGKISSMINVSSIIEDADITDSLNMAYKTFQENTFRPMITRDNW